MSEVLQQICGLLREVSLHSWAATLRLVVLLVTLAVVGVALALTVPLG